MKECPFCRQDIVPTKNRLIVDLMDHFYAADRGYKQIQMKPVKTKKQETLEAAKLYNYQEVIYLIYMDLKTPLERVISIQQSKSELNRLT